MASLYGSINFDLEPQRKRLSRTSPGDMIARITLPDVFRDAITRKRQLRATNQSKNDERGDV